jgi:uncharacterized integral membrane protein
MAQQPGQPPFTQPPAQQPPFQPPGPGYGAPSGAMPAPSGASAPAEPASHEQPAQPYGFDDKGHVKRTKVSGVWIGIIAATILLILLIIFIAQNLHPVRIHFLAFDGKFSIGLALLVAAIVGVLIAAVPGTVRILQLRKSLRRNVDTGN